MNELQAARWSRQNHEKTQRLQESTERLKKRMGGGAYQVEEAKHCTWSSETVRLQRYNAKKRRAIGNVYEEISFESHFKVS